MNPVSPPRKDGASPDAPGWIVGIGASAGGLEALTRLLGGLPPRMPAALVVVQHMSHTHRSLLVQLLARETSLHVCEIEDGMRPMTGTVQIAPARFDLEIRDGCYRLISNDVPGIPVPSVNRFLLSLADACGPKAAAVILSGTGNDGAQGLRAVKLAGGATFAQNSASARYDGMPQAAMETGAVDAALLPEGIAVALADLVSAGIKPEAANAIANEQAPTWAKLMRLMREHTGVDIGAYKESTIERRVARRVTALRLGGMDEYVARCEADPRELDLLLKEALISVTSFFRDREAYNALEAVVAGIVSGRQGGDEIRVWVPGCATGEEVYSLAMLFIEKLATRTDPPQFKVFATDLDAAAMQVARRACYSRESLAGLAPERLTRFFTEVNGGYEAKPLLRDPVVFARHDLTRDPPFLRIDLVSCRNLLIYFKPSLQARVVPMLAYAAAPRGYLFLGKSESVVQFQDLFDVVDKGHRIFRSRGARFDVLGYTAQARPESPRPRAAKSEDLNAMHERAAMRLHAPPSVLLSGDGQILNTAGEVSRYLSFPSGRLLLNIANVMDSLAAIEAQSLLLRAARTRMRITGRTQTGADGGSYRLVLDPVTDEDDRYLMAFIAVTDVADLAGKSAAGNGEVTETLRHELTVTREHLQTVIEELETSNEEMQALNEELQSANEELQSTNEELETSNEELQSTNEELSTVNDELEKRAEQLSLLSTDLVTIMQSLPYPVALFDDAMRIARSNPAAEQFFNIGPELSKTALDKLTFPPALAGAPEMIRRIMREGGVIDSAVKAGGRDYLLHIAPCVGADAARGVLFELVDISETVMAKQALAAAEARHAMIDHSSLAIATANIQGNVDYVNPRFLDWAGVTRGRVLGRPMWQLFGGESTALFRHRAHAVINADEVIEGELPYTIDGKSGTVHAIWFTLKGPDGRVNGFCFKALDVSARIAAVQALARSEALHRALSAAMPSEIAVLDAEGGIISVNDAWLRFARANGARSDDEWVGQNYLAACRPEAGNPAELADGIRSVLAGRVEMFECEYPCDGPNEQRWFRMIAVRMNEGDARAAVMHTDISGAKLAQIAAQGQLDAARGRGDAREQDLLQAIDEIEMFSYTVSHDLRTPLRALVSFSDILLAEHRSALPVPALAHVERISAAGLRMRHYIDELLKLSHLARGGLSKRTVDLSAMAGEVMAEMRVQYVERQVDASVASDMQVQAEPALLRAVLENLIGNAWKYLDPHRRGEVSVGSRTEGDVKAFFVHDNGIGFDMSFRDKLFMPFQRLHPETDIPGNGLGLAAAKRIVVRHGGRIWAEARPGYGATFYFTLP